MHPLEYHTIEYNYTDNSARIICCKGLVLKISQWKIMCHDTWHMKGVKIGKQARDQLFPGSGVHTPQWHPTWTLVVAAHQITINCHHNTNVGYIYGHNELGHYDPSQQNGQCGDHQNKLNRKCYG